MNKKLNIFFILICIFNFSCKKSTDFNPPNDLNKGSVSGFSYRTTKDIDLKVKVLQNQNNEEIFKINVYINEPILENKILSGITNKSSEFNRKITIGNSVEYLYIEKIDFYNTKEIQKVLINDILYITFKQNDYSYFIKKSSSGLDCINNCVSNYNDLKGSLILNSNISCITGNDTINKLTLNNNSIVKMYGSGIIDTLVLNGNSRCYILDNSEYIINTIIDDTNTKFINWSSNLTFNKCLKINGYYENNNHLFVGCDITIEKDGILYNYGNLKTSVKLICNGTIINYNFIECNDFETKNHSVLNNFCSLIVKNNATIKGEFNNYSFFKVLNNLIIFNSSTVKQTTSLISCNNLELKGDVIGIGNNTSYIKVLNITNIFNSANISGLINICDINNIENNNGNIITPAKISCNGYLNKNFCNTEGFGYIVIIDSDNDGVSDLFDEYPYDNLRAFNSYFPCYNTCGNLAFEDLWVSKGDYDFNDVVLAFNINKVFNANGKVIDYKLKILPLAIGGTYVSGFGILLDNISNSDVKSVTGQIFSKSYINLNSNNTESSQTEAVIICYDSPEPLLHRVGGSMFNTLKTNAKGTSDTAFINITFLNYQEDSVIGFNKFNPFIIPNGVRNKEIHLINKKPTNLVDFSLFGTNVDRSNPLLNIYYVNNEGLPWGILIPETFNYPSEKNSIKETYFYFDKWVLSNGILYPNWYRNFPQYRDNNKVY